MFYNIFRMPPKKNNWNNHLRMLTLSPYLENFAVTQHVFTIINENTHQKKRNPKQTTTMKRISTFLAALLCTASAIFADLPFRNHRYDSFRVLDVTSDNIVFIGNSITDMHCWHEAFKTSTGEYLPIVNRICGNMLISG